MESLIQLHAKFSIALMLLYIGQVKLLIFRTKSL